MVIPIVLEPNYWENVNSIHSAKSQLIIMLREAEYLLLFECFTNAREIAYLRLQIQSRVFNYIGNTT